MKERWGRNTGNTFSNVMIGILVIILLAAVGYFPYAFEHNKVKDLHAQVATLQAQLKSAKQSSPTQPNTSSTIYLSKNNATKVIVYSPSTNSKITSPLAVVGEVPGSWSSEASFPVKLYDGKGNIVAQTTAQVLGDWMSDQLVPFSAKLTFSDVPPGSGRLIMLKDNPSGLAKNDDSVSIPVDF